MKIKINLDDDDDDEDDDLSLEKTINMQNVIIFTGPFSSDNYNHYYSRVSLIKRLRKIAE